MRSGEMWSAPPWTRRWPTAVGRAASWSSTANTAPRWSVTPSIVARATGASPSNTAYLTDDEPQLIATIVILASSRHHPGQVQSRISGRSSKWVAMYAR